jgi:prepilin-type N-terminal cleavage/methylation domain-containing protein
MKETCYRNSTRGFTLIEMLVVIGIIGIILPVLVGSIASLYSTHGRTLARALALSEATKGTREIVRDVRAAVYAEDGALPIVSIATSSFTFFVDTDFDGRVERVRYTLNGTSIEKGVIEPTASATYPVGSETVRVLVRDIVNSASSTPVFRYFSATSTEITTSAQALMIRRVEVQLVGSPTAGKQANRISVHSSASIRNLKDTY